MAVPLCKQRKKSKKQKAPTKSGRTSLIPTSGPAHVHRPQKHKICTMADKAVENATAAMSEVRLDENGQPLSKNALKKLLKAEAAAKKKAEKAAAKVST